jgi:hypothetical protein
MTAEMQRVERAEVAAPAGNAEGIEGMLQNAIAQGDKDTIKLVADLFKQERDDQRRRAFYVALAEFQRICPAIEKKDKAHNNSYAKLGRIIEAVREPLHSCGLSCRYETSQREDGTVEVTCILTHKDGHSERSTLCSKPDTSGSKNAIQAVGSATEYLRRYTFGAATGIVTVDADTDGGASSAVVTPAQAAELQRAVDELESVSLVTLLAFGQCASLAEFPASKLGDAMQTIKRHRAKERGGKK